MDLPSPLRAPSWKRASVWVTVVPLLCLWVLCVFENKNAGTRGWFDPIFFLPLSVDTWLFREAQSQGPMCCNGQSTGLGDGYQSYQLLSISCVLVTWLKVLSFPFTSEDRWGLETLIYLPKIMELVRRLDNGTQIFMWFQNPCFLFVQHSVSQKPELVWIPSSATS